MKIKSQILAITSFIALSSSLTAAVTLTDSANGAFSSISTNPFTYTVQNAASQLVIGFYVDRDEDPTGINFGGVAADGFFNNGRTWLAYWDNPAIGGGTLEVVKSPAFPGGSDFFVGAYELAGVDLSKPVTQSTGSSITTLTDNEYVVSFSGVNGDSTVTPGGSSIIDTDVFTWNSSDVTSGGGGAVGGGAGQAGLAGSQDVSWNTGSTISYSFQAAAVVPEPSAALLGGLGALALMLRRRR